MSTTKRVSEIAMCLTVLSSILRPELQEAWEMYLESLTLALPSGSGFDSGSKLDESSTPNKLVFSTAFHHMDEAGYYDGWTEHKVIVTPTFGGIDVRVTGKNRNQIKEYISEVFYSLLQEEVAKYGVSEFLMKV